MTTYRIDQHGPYRRWILVCDGEDVSAHATRDEAERALARHKASAIEARRAKTQSGSVHESAVPEGQTP